MSLNSIFYISNRIKRRYRAWHLSSMEPYRSGRDMFVLEGVLFAVALNLTWGMFLAGYLKEIGINDALNGFIAVLPALAGIIQPLGAYTFNKTLQKKRLLIVLFALHRIPYSFLYILPLFIQGTAARTTAIVILVILFNFLNNFVSPPIIDWIANLTPANIRGKYFSLRDIIMVMVFSTTNLVGGFVLDYYNKAHNPMVGFTIIGVAVILLFIGNVITVSKIYEPPVNQSNNSIKLKDVYFVPFKDKLFRRCIIVSMIWNFAFQLGIPYYNVYLVSYLNLDYTFIMSVGFIATIERLFVVKFWWRLAEKKSWTYVSQVMLIFVGISYMAHAFITKENSWWLYTFLVLAVNIAWAVIMAGLLNLQLDNAPEDKRAAYIGANAAAQGITGFIGGSLGAYIMHIIGRGFLGIFTAPQWLVLASGLLIVCSGLYIKFYIRGKKRYAIH